MFVVFDLDGTMSDGSHKDHLLRRPENPGDPWPEQDWAAWTEACIHDALIEPIAHTARAMIEAGHRVEFWTGRGEDAREVTERWLDKHGFCTCDNCQPLRMRPLHEPTTADYVMKERYLERYGVPDLVFEDRTSVVEMWRSHGILCCQVAPNNY